MFIELHLLQNFAPSNLNRDDTGSPKDCEFGGYRRARISSQCFKRSIRETFASRDLVPAAHRSARTKRLLEDVTQRLVTAGQEPAAARAVTIAALEGIGFGLKEDDKTQYLLFLGQDEIEAFTRACLAYWETLAEIAPEPVAEENGTEPRRGAKEGKKAKRAALTGPAKAALLSAISSSSAVDLALFGRMLADLPEKNVDAACQVAHALSTNKVSVEFDFYTAVDDLKPEDTAGADMLGTIEFNSACFYRYANIDFGQLTKNLGDAELARQAVDAFIRAAIAAIPTGKQNSMAAQNPPSLVFAVVRRHGLWSLANAFVNPVRPNGQSDLIRGSIAELDRYWGNLTAMYGDGDLITQAVALTEPDGVKHLAASRVGSCDELLGAVQAAIANRNGGVA